MLEQLKEELVNRLKNSQEHEDLERLYNHQVKILFESIIDAQNVDDIAINIKLKMAQELFKEHHYKRALQILEDLLANQEFLTEEIFLQVRNYQGLALIYSGKYEEAELIFKEMVEADITYYKCKGLINLGITYYHLTKYAGKRLLQESNHLFIKAKTLVAEDNLEDRFQISYNLAIIFYEQGKFTEGFEQLEEALGYAQREQQRAMVYNELARFYITQSDLQEAQRYLDQGEQILIKRPHFHELALAWNLHIRGLWYKKMGQYSNAINCLELALTTFVDREFFSEAAEVSYELYVLNKFLEDAVADDYLADYQFYSRLIS